MKKKTVKAMGVAVGAAMSFMAASEIEAHAAENENGENTENSGEQSTSSAEVTEEVAEEQSDDEYVEETLTANVAVYEEAIDESSFAQPSGEMTYDNFSYNPLTGVVEASLLVGDDFDEEIVTSQAFGNTSMDNTRSAFMTSPRMMMFASPAPAPEPEPAPDPELSPEEKAQEAFFDAIEVTNDFVIYADELTAGERTEVDWSRTHWNNETNSQDYAYVTRNTDEHTGHIDGNTCVNEISNVSENIKTGEVSKDGEVVVFNMNR